MMLTIDTILNIIVFFMIAYDVWWAYKNWKSDQELMMLDRRVDKNQRQLIKYLITTNNQLAVLECLIERLAKETGDSQKFNYASLKVIVRKIKDMEDNGK